MNFGIEDLSLREQQNVVNLGVGCLTTGLFYTYFQYDGTQHISTLFCLSVAVVCSLVSWCFIVYTVWKFTEVKDFYLQDSFVSEDEVRQSLVAQRENRARRAQVLESQLERIEEDNQGEAEESDHGDGEASENGTGRGTGYTGSEAARDEIEVDVDRVEDENGRIDVENDDLPLLVEDSVDSEIDEISIGGTSDDSWATDLGERDMESRPLLGIDSEVDEEMESMQSFDEIVANLNNRSVEELQSLMDADLEQLGPPISLSDTNTARDNRSIINRPLRNSNPTNSTQTRAQSTGRRPLVRRPLVNSRLLHAEVAIRNGYHVDITTDGEMNTTELNALTDIALMRLLNVWMGSTETQSRTNVHGVTQNSPSLFDHFIAGGREFVEILMSYSVDIPYAGPYILTSYLFILNAIERTLSSFRSDVEADDSESEDESVCSEETIVSDGESSEIEHIDSGTDIEIKVVFLDDRREVLKVHPDSRLKNLKSRLVSDKNLNLRYVQNGKVLDDSLSYKQLGICDENNSRVLHCIKSKKPENKKNPVKKIKKTPQQASDLNNNFPENSGSQPQSSSINKVTAKINTFKNWAATQLPVIKQKMVIGLHQTLYLFQKYRENILVGLIILWTLHMFHIYAYASSYVILTFDSNEPLSMLLNAITILSVTILHTMV